MSYILDALKKSEQERPPGPVPDLFTVHGPQPPSPRRRTRIIAAVALLLVVPAILLWAWIRAGRRDEGAARPPVVVSPQPRAEIPAAGVTPRTVAASAPPAPARAAVVAAARGPADKRSPTLAPPAQQSRRVAAPSVVPLAIPAVAPATAAPAPAPVPAAPIFIPKPPAPASAPAAIPPPLQSGGQTPTALAPSPVSNMPSPGIPAAAPGTSPEPVPAVPASEETPPADGRVLNLAELPTPIRAELPKLLVSGHVWSEEPALRRLSVDDRLLHEGGEAAPGVSLREITPAGAVFDYKGWHFRVAGGRQ